MAIKMSRKSQLELEIKFSTPTDTCLDRTKSRTGYHNRMVRHLGNGCERLQAGLMTISGEFTAVMTLKGQKVNSTDQYTYLGYIMNRRWEVSGGDQYQQQ
ncbi:hypothetical protein AYI69_g3576 [Smittium culicis]|uniref:Uncharacterized protein n=1 Tax=Smittium culicis TaxID=133412 RepID=A0A1R1YJD7_9FUNG|nr:hypothetical protein AYI69_g3576 [Smittium culicis]